MKRAIALMAVVIALAFAGDGRGQTPMKKSLSVRTLTTTNSAGMLIHEAVLTWDQSIPSPNSECPDQTTNTAITSNNLYRTTAGGASGTETLLASLTPAATTYTDLAVGAGDTYLYEVTAVNCPNDGGPQESARSNELSVLIPNTFIGPPPAPTNLTLVKVQ